MYYEPPSPVTLITLYDPGPPMQPVSNTSIERVMLGSAQRGIYAAPGTHCDHVNITDTVCSRVNVCIAIDNQQSVEWNIHNLVALGPHGGDCVFDVRQGGRLLASIAVVDQWDAIIRTGRPEQPTGFKNAGFYDIRVSMDNTSSFAHSLVERNAYQYGQTWVDIHGVAAQETSIGPPVLLNPDTRLHVDVKRIGAADHTFSQGAP